jgi:8-oxo-dGTP pyrophosphatase MutT (NUDIX family)
MSFDQKRLNSFELISWLEQRLRQPLPGPMMGTKYAPRPALGRDYSRIPADARPAAVLILFYRHESQWWLPLTLRKSTLPDHGGQISFPGGAIEPGETSCEAAIREFREELGVVDFRPQSVLGQLSSIYIERSRFRVDPWVAVAEERPKMCAQPCEVEELLEVPLLHLLDPANFGSHQREYHGQVYEAPHFVFGSHRIWGATCLILGELITLVEEFLGKRASSAP